MSVETSRADLAHWTRVLSDHRNACKNTTTDEKVEMALEVDLVIGRRLAQLSPADQRRPKDLRLLLELSLVARRSSPRCTIPREG